MKKITLLLCAFFVVISTIHGQSLLWKVSGNGLKSPSYLFGTHHLAPLSVLDSIKGFKAAFDATTQVVGEIETAKMQSQECIQLMQKMMMISSDTTATMLFNDKELEMVNAFLKENMGIELSQMPKIKPAFINNMATVITYTKMIPGFNAQQQIDGYIQSQGIANSKKLVALESIDFQLNLLFNSQSLQRQAHLLICLFNNRDKLVTDIQDLNKAYFSYDLQKLVDLSEKREGNSCDPLPGEMEGMLKNRNHDWITKLPSIMKAAPSFIAIGALHLPGENGLITLLKKKGYKVEPIK